MIELIFGMDFSFLVNKDFCINSGRIVFWQEYMMAFYFLAKLRKTVKRNFVIHS
jgi:hypothetical protein